MTNPTPAQRAQQLLYSVITTTSVIKREYWEEEMLKTIAAALLAERQAQMEADCGVLCPRCKRGDAPKLNKAGDTYVHYVVSTGFNVICDATPLRAAFAAAGEAGR